MNKFTRYTVGLVATLATAFLLGQFVGTLGLAPALTGTISFFIGLIVGVLGFSITDFWAQSAR